MTTRAQVLNHRWRVQGLDRSRASCAAILDLGVVDVPTPAAATALALRGGAPDEELVLVWGARGAPALHRRSALQSVAEALWPDSDEDATRRIANPRIAEGARLGLDAFRAVADAVHEVLAAAGDLVTKSELSRGVSDRVPDSLNYDCEPCGSRHVSGSVLQDAGLAGGAELVRVGRATQFRLLHELRVPQQRNGFGQLVAAYLHVCGPAAPADVASYFGVAVTDVRSAWPQRTTELEVEGRTVTALTEDVDSFATRTARPKGLRLLPPGDPWLQARDRTFTVAKEHHPKIWKAISPPGAVLVDGELRGTWRASAKGRRVDLTVSPFTDLTEQTWRSLDDESAHVASARGLSEARIVRD